jgi:membrane protein YqaA with SNARE-associated domain
MLDPKLLKKMAVGLVILLLAAGVLGVVLRDPLTAASSWFVDRFGLAGVFAAVMFTDTSPLPLTHEPVLLLGVIAGIDPWVLFAVAATASTLSGPVGYGGGWCVRRSDRFKEWLQRRAPDFTAWMQLHGAKGVAVAALLPIPFAVSTWTAGMTGVNLPKVLAASLLRIPKTGFYLLLIVKGWALGA